jgi:O-antigen/teichoic acid export membrane protein
VYAARWRGIRAFAPKTAINRWITDLSTNRTSPPREQPPVSGILRNSVFVLSARGLQIVASFLVFVAVARYLSVRQYGEYAFIIAFVSSIMALSYFGIQQVLVREVAGDMRNAAMYVGAAIRLRSLLSAGATVVLVGAMFFVGLSPAAVAAGMIAVLSELFLTFAMLSKAVFQAFERMVYEPLVTVAYSLALLVGMALVIFLDMGFLWLFIALAAANAVQFSLAGYIVSSRFVRPSLGTDKGVFGRLLKDAVVIGVGVFFYQNLFKINVLMLKWFGSVQDVSYFQVPHSMIIQLQVVPLALVTALFPVLSRLMRNEHARVAGLYEKAFRYLVVFSFLIGMYFCLLSEEIIDVFFGAKYANSVSALLVIAWGIIPLSLGMLLTNILIAMNKQKFIVMYAGATLFINLLLAYLLVPSYGYMASAYIAVFSYALLFVFSFSLVSRSGFPIAIGRTVSGTLLSGLLGGAALILLRPLSLPFAVAAGMVLYLFVQVMTRTILKEELLSLRGRFGGKGGRY